MMRCGREVLSHAGPSRVVKFYIHLYLGKPCTLVPVPDEALRLLSKEGDDVGVRVWRRAGVRRRYAGHRTVVQDITGYALGVREKGMQFHLLLAGGT
jgi:hypothetical protein